MNKRLEFGLTDIERNQKEAARRLRNTVLALMVVLLCGGALNYLTQLGQ